MEDHLKELRDRITAHFLEKTTSHQVNVIDSQHYQQELKYIRDITFDFIDSLRAVSANSTRAGKLYNDFLTIRAIDDLIQSAIGIFAIVENGIHNTARRELRYMIEMMTKFVIVDYEKMGANLDIKTQYLATEIPKSSIDIIEKYIPPLNASISRQFRSEVKDFFIKTSAYVHPSKMQMEERIKNYMNGNTIGFESAKMFADVNKSIFRTYDMILVMMFHGFGPSMSGDLFIELFDRNKKWKFHKGKYVKEYAKFIANR